MKRSRDHFNVALHLALFYFLGVMVGRQGKHEVWWYAVQTVGLFGVLWAWFELADRVLAPLLAKRRA